MAPPEESKGPEGSGAPKKSGDGKENSSGGRSGRKGNRFRRGRRRGRGQRPRPQGGGGGERAERAERTDPPQVAEIFPEAGGVAGLVDSHVHLEDAVYNGDRRKVFERALSRGVGTIITVGSDIESSRKTLDIAKTFPGVFAAVGIHPHEVKNMANKSASAIKSLSESSKVVAIGEIGLDYHYNHSPRKLQRHWFREQIRLAVKVGKPVIVHCRDAGDDT